MKRQNRIAVALLVFGVGAIGNVSTVGLGVTEARAGIRDAVKEFTAKLGKLREKIDSVANAVVSVASTLFTQATEAVEAARNEVKSRVEENRRWIEARASGLGQRVVVCAQTTAQLIVNGAVEGLQKAQEKLSAAKADAFDKCDEKKKAATDFAVDLSLDTLKGEIESVRDTLKETARNFSLNTIKTFLTKSDEELLDDPAFVALRNKRDEIRQNIETKKNEWLLALQTLRDGVEAFVRGPISNFSLVCKQPGSALVVCIENTADSTKKDGFFETLNEQKARDDFARFASAYEDPRVLTDCTSTAFLGALGDLHNARNNPRFKIDVAMLVHGGATSLSFHDGEKNGDWIAAIRAPSSSTNSAQEKFNLNAVFQLNCEGGQLNPKWIAAGAKAVVGTRKGNDRVLAYNTFFPAWVEDGLKFGGAVDNLNNNLTPADNAFRELTRASGQIDFLCSQCPPLPPGQSNPCENLKASLGSSVAAVVCQYRQLLKDGYWDSTFIMEGDANIKFFNRSRPKIFPKARRL